MQLSPQEIKTFQQTVQGYFTAYGRNLPWRTPSLQPEADGTLNPYAILVSELMLQQTQVGRVIPKYHEFMMCFPTIESLAAAELGDVLRVWNGLGYNRRAKYLWQTAREVMSNFGGALPRDLGQLQTLPGIGKNTAGAIMAYAFNEPVVFVETNIRTVYIYHFFRDQTDIPDTDLIPLIARTLPQESSILSPGRSDRMSHEDVLSKPQARRKEQGQFCLSEGESTLLAPSRQTISPSRTWYWALMDYGSYLKSTVGNAARSSKQYARQSVFQGSNRQVRGQVLRSLHDRPLSFAELKQLIPDERLEGVLYDLLAEAMITYHERTYSL